MKKFLINIIVFTIVVFATSFALGEIEYSNSFLIEKTKDTAYEKVGWNLSMLENSKDQIKGSKVFFGSSYVLNGVNDSVLTNNGVRSFNFAVRHNGNDLSLFFLKLKFIN